MVGLGRDTLNSAGLGLEQGSAEECGNPDIYGTHGCFDPRSTLEGGSLKGEREHTSAKTKWMESEHGSGETRCQQPVSLPRATVQPQISGSPTVYYESVHDM